MILQYATGQYIAVMDADDIMLASRLEKQVAFLETHLNIGVLGTFATEIDEKGIYGNIFWFYCCPPGFTNLLSVG